MFGVAVPVYAISGLLLGLLALIGLFGLRAQYTAG